jgi:hypothetical protein
VLLASGKYSMGKVAKELRVSYTTLWRAVGKIEVGGTDKKQEMLMKAAILALMAAFGAVMPAWADEAQLKKYKDYTPEQIRSLFT